MVAIARLGYRLNAVTLGAQFPAKRPDHCVDDIAADECTSPDAFDELLAANDRGCAIDELGQNLRFQRREFDDSVGRSRFRGDPVRIPGHRCEGIELGPASTRAQIHSTMSAPGTSSTMVVGSSVRDCSRKPKPQTLQDDSIFSRGVTVDSRQAEALDVVALEIQDAGGTRCRVFLAAPSPISAG